MTKQESIKFLQSCIDSLEKLKEEQLQKIQDIYNEELKKEYPNSSWYPIPPKDMSIKEWKKFIEGDNYADRR